MQASAPVVLYETRPNTEWLLGGPVQKMSPQYAHGRLQGKIFAMLDPWAADRGRLATEWRFWLTPAGEQARYLIPDVAYLSYARLARDAGDAAHEPRIAPDVIFEVRSPGDRPILIAHKIDVYLRSGTALIVYVDPIRHEFRGFTPAGELRWGSGETFEHPVLPEFSLEIAQLFA